MIPVNLGDDLQLLDLIPVASVAATGNGTGVDLLGYEGEILVTLDCANVDGTNPTMDVTLEHSDVLGSGYAAISGAAFTQVTTVASAQKMSLNKNELKRYLRAVKTLGGTMSPHFYVSVKAVGMKKYQ